jgi:hypothetical protein
VPAEIEKEEGQAEQRQFLLQIVQPGLAGPMDGSVSTLAPLSQWPASAGQNLVGIVPPPCFRGDCPSERRNALIFWDCGQGLRS